MAAFYSIFSKKDWLTIILNTQSLNKYGMGTLNVMDCMLKVVGCWLNVC